MPVARDDVQRRARVTTASLGVREVAEQQSDDDVLVLRPPTPTPHTAHTPHTHTAHTVTRLATAAGVRSTSGLPWRRGWRCGGCSPRIAANKSHHGGVLRSHATAIVGRVQPRRHHQPRPPIAASRRRRRRRHRSDDSSDTRTLGAAFAVTSIYFPGARGAPAELSRTRSGRVLPGLVRFHARPFQSANSS